MFEIADENIYDLLKNDHQSLQIVEDIMGHRISVDNLAVSKIRIFYEFSEKFHLLKNFFIGSSY